jgi:signal transduction histidine kinase
VTDSIVADPAGSPQRPADAEEPGAELARLRRRVTDLEREHRQAFEQAQREADALFAQYQLSQLIATAATPSELSRAVVVELVRLAGAESGALWLGESGSDGLVLVAATGSIDWELPDQLEDLDAARRLASADPARELVILGDEPPVTVLLVTAPPGGTLDRDGLRIVQLARHELAVAFVGARLRAALDREREELRSVVAGATDAIVQVDESLRVVRLNPAAERLLGTDDGPDGANGAIGRTCGEVLGCAVAGGHGDDQCPLAEVLASGQPIAYRETALRGAEGDAVRVAGGYSRAPMTPGGPIRATAILRDISAVRALEQLREGFVATVSHELRTPLALVRGYAESILHLGLPPEQEHEYVDRIHQVTSRLGDLVDQILDVTHLDADPLILERAPVAFASLVARCRGDLALSGDDSRLVADLAGDLPPIDVDSARIGRVLENLVGNALKYAPAGSPVTIGASVEEGWLWATVDDDGVGIPEEERSLVLEPFHRAWNVRESRIPGTGLGLYICRRLVEAHGGRLTIGERPNGAPGTRVTFSVPVLAGGRRAIGAGRRRGPTNGDAGG